MKSATLFFSLALLAAVAFAQEPVNHNLYQPVAYQPVAYQPQAEQPLAYQPSVDLHGAWHAPAPYLSEPLLSPTSALHQPLVTATSMLTQPQQHQLSVTQLMAGQSCTCQ